MKLRDIITGKNNVDYNAENMQEIEINNMAYKTDSGFNHYSPKGIIGLAFGAENQYNKIIAKSILDGIDYWDKVDFESEDFEKPKEIPVYVQTEIGNCLDKQDFKDYKNFGETYEEDEEVSGVSSKVSTKDILEEIKKDMDKDIDEEDPLMAYFAHPAHIYRVMEIGRKVGISGKAFIPKNVVWPENDPQEWVRNPKDWKKREFMGRVHHWILGWVPREL